METTMTLARDNIATVINSLNDEQFFMVAIYVKSIAEENTVATREEVAALTKEFNAKYEKTFRALAQS